MSDTTAVEARRPDAPGEPGDEAARDRPTPGLDRTGDAGRTDVHGAPDPGDRGSLVVRDRVVQRIAEAAVLEVDGVVRHAEGLDRVTGHDLPDVEVVVAGTRARASVTVAVVWGVSLADVAARARDTVTHALARMAGLTVDAVDVRVAHVSTEVPTRRRVR